MHQDFHMPPWGSRRSAYHRSISSKHAAIQISRQKFSFGRNDVEEFKTVDETVWNNKKFTLTASLPNENEKTYPCQICGRHFVRNSLEKHEPVCKKMAKSRRKIFDSGKQRATGSDVSINDVRNAQKEREKLGGTFPRPKTSWREKHETFISAVSASRQVDYALKTGTPLPPPPKTSVPKVLSIDELEALVRKHLGCEESSQQTVDDQSTTIIRSAPNDYVQCEYCGRNFSANAAERHIPFCRDQYERKGPIKVNPHSAKPLPPKHNNASMGPPTGHSLSSQRGETPPRTHPRRVSSRHASAERERPSPGSRQSPIRSTINSAGTVHRSNLPTPIKRSSSASRVASSSHSRGQLKTFSTIGHPARH